MRVPVILLAAASALGATPAQAQLNNGASGYSSADRTVSNQLYWNFLDQIGPCLANQKEDQSTAFVDSVIGSREETEAFDVLFNRGRNRRNNCMGNFSGVYGAQRAHIRGSVAEGLFERLPDDVIAAFIATPPAGPERIDTLHDFARCYVVAHPETTREFLRRTDNHADGEMEFIAERMMGDFGPCLPEGRDVEFTAISVRASFAEAAWRAATGRPAPQMQGSN